MISIRKESWTMGEEKRRKRWRPEEIAGVLRRHLVEKVELSRVCEEAGCCPSQVYRWQNQLFGGAAAIFSRKNGSRDRELKAAKARAADLEKKLQRKHEVLSELMEEHLRLKKSWGRLVGRWVPHDTRDEVVDFVNGWSEKTEVPQVRFTRWLGLRRGKFCDWRRRYGKVNEHNAWVPRDHWLEDREKKAIIGYYLRHPPSISSRRQPRCMPTSS